MRADITERLLRGLYSALLVVLAPVTVYHLIWRGFRQSAYLLRWDERYGIYRAPAETTPVWVHAVSVGEVNAAAPLINALLARDPARRLLVTTITPTGSERVRALWGQRVEHVYLPYDLSGAVRRFLRHFRPQIGLIVETELWPNLLFCCRDAGVPTMIVNARLSARSLRGYRVLRPLVGRALRTVKRVATQSADDGKRFVKLGARRETVVDTGNLKFDITPDEAKITALRDEFRRHAGVRPVWIAASTHPDEEAAVVDIHRQLRARWPDLLLIWAPRHPERFRGAMQLAVEAGWRVATRALTTWPDSGDNVFVLDTLGELGLFFACADVAFVGGSLQDIGGHNLLEPAAVGTPVVTGPHLQNFTDIARQLERAGALRIGADADAVRAHIAALLEDPQARRAMGEAGRALVVSGRGTLARTLALIEPDLPAPDTKTARTLRSAPSSL
ncbi:lipid IV(A) 3-deoxy-D-manno-octulosonic acid transferase [Luteimonas sp. 100069]|uniref:lipid IV(A) 3-deoxy-D-manno-octulosonic acid transferase n=1 Tax=Luteimonas sp. 100069 TaxID=2006109 RepID=UPI000F4D6462|nr:lipid IV(A) 3-deoxy-D-manno-octulosonic acid transferase [Luteimonas sp. 100069]RPD83460.1 3-deoxy-D-manno-octulosonic acid transferase [Luteimonas sp. 100069]